MCATLLAGCASTGAWLVPDRADAPAAPAPAGAASQVREGVTVTVWPARFTPGIEPPETVFGLRVKNEGSDPLRLGEPFAWLSDARDRDLRPMIVFSSAPAVVSVGQTWEGQVRFPGLGGNSDAVVLTVAAARDAGPVRFFFRYRVVQRAPEPQHPAADEL